MSHTGPLTLVEQVFRAPSVTLCFLLLWRLRPSPSLMVNLFRTTYTPEASSDHMLLPTLSLSCQAPLPSLLLQSAVTRAWELEWMYA